VLTRWVVRRVTILAGAVLLLPCASFADELTVDCSGGTPGAYTSIQDAIGALGPGGPTPPWDFHRRHIITVLSDCVGRVPIFDRQGLTIRAPEGETVTITPPSPNGFVVMVGGSQGILLERLVISGGDVGILLFDLSEVDISDCTIEDNSGDGLNVQGNSIAYIVGDASLDLAAIRNNGGYGVSVLDASEILAWEATIEGNDRGGLFLRFGGTAGLHGAMLIRNNGTAGEPDSAGIHLGGGATLLVRHEGNEIANNFGPGILADVNSTVSVADGRIENNTGDGVRVLHMSVAKFGPGNTLAGNGEASIYCDSTSMAFGDLADIDGIECDNLEFQITLCHIPPGNPGNAQTITVDESAVPAHLAHGDTLGPCDDGNADSHQVEIEAGQYDGGLKEPMFDPRDAQSANPTGSETGDRDESNRTLRHKRHPRRPRRQGP
jgi:hypothetical protein